MKVFILFLCCSALLCSCYSFRVNQSPGKNEVPDQINIERKTVYVINPEMTEEYAILLESNIFNIVTDSQATGVFKIKLLPPARQVRCANFLIGWGMFLGQIPVTVSSGRNFRISQISDGEETIEELELPVYTRYWFWDIFSRRKNYKKAAGVALRHSFTQAR